MARSVPIILAHDSNMTMQSYGFWVGFNLTTNLIIVIIVYRCNYVIFFFIVASLFGWYYVVLRLKILKFSNVDF